MKGLRLALGMCALAVLPVVGGCEAAPSSAAETRAGAEKGTPVDSIFPVEVEIERFLATLDEAPDTLRRAENSRDAVVLAFVQALESADADALTRMILDRAEFGHLYYPDSRYARPPYRLSPALAWYQMQNRSSRGLSRLLSRYAGHELGYSGYTCPDEPEVEGENRYWHGCVVEQAAPGTLDREPAPIRLFGSIMEREGRYKLVGFSNDL